jgi:hypothetical protein
MGAYFQKTYLASIFMDILCPSLNTYWITTLESSEICSDTYGIIPFSVLLTSSFIQDGHGMLPLLSYSVKDSILIKLFNLVFGVAVGILLYKIGL